MSVSLVGHQHTHIDRHTTNELELTFAVGANDKVKHKSRLTKAANLISVAGPTTTTTAVKKSQLKQ